MDVIVLLAVIAVPIGLVFILGRTPLWWLSGCAIAGLATYLLSTLAPAHGHLRALDDLGNLMQSAAGVALLLYAAALLVAARARYAHAHRPPPIPPAVGV